MITIKPVFSNVTFIGYIIFNVALMEVLFSGVFYWLNLLISTLYSVIFYDLCHLLSATIYSPVKLTLLIKIEAAYIRFSEKVAHASTFIWPYYAYDYSVWTEVRGTVSGLEIQDWTFFQKGIKYHYPMGTQTSNWCQNVFYIMAQHQ